MAGDASEALRSKLDEFSRRLDAKIKEFHERGELSLDQSTISSRLQERRASTQRKLDVAIEKEREADILKYEFERDLNDLAADFETFLRQIDVAADAASPGRSRL